MLKLFFIFFFKFIIYSAEEYLKDNNTNIQFPKFPWSENVPKLEFTTSIPINSTLKLTKKTLAEKLKNGEIPKEIKPYLNMTAIEILKKSHNESLDFIIRDEDVADIPDDDEGNQPKINTITHDGNKSIIFISDQAKHDLYQHWIDQSLSGLMGAVVTNFLNKKKLTKKEKKEHYYCTQSAKNVTAHAQCVVKVFDIVEKRNEKLKIFSTLTKRMKNYRERNRINNEIWKKSIKNYDDFIKSGSEEYRVKRAVNFGLFDEYDKQKKTFETYSNQKKIKNQKSFSLIEEKSLSPLALIARKLTQLVRIAKNTTEPQKRWQDVIQDIKEESLRIKSKKKNKERMKRKFSKFVQIMKETGIDSKKTLKSIGMEDLFDDDPILSDKEQDKKDKKEMMQEMSIDDKIMYEPIKLIREGLKLGMMSAGKNVSNFDDKKIAVLSPQFMSVLPDEVANDTISLLSPSILSLHGEGNDLERQLSLTKALKLMADTGQEEWMNFVLEASGVTEAVKKMRMAEAEEEAEEIQRDFVDKEGRPTYFTKENLTEIYGKYEAGKIDHFEKLYKSMTDEQMKEMNTTGYSIMNDKQLELMYGNDSPYNDTNSLNKFKKIKKKEMPKIMENNIRLLAEQQMKFEVSRKKDIVLSPLITLSVVLDPVLASQGIILSPVVLTPIILSPSIYGNIILSPWVFVPVIVAPRLLGAVVLSPVVFSPVVLSPLCLVPVILSPAAGLPLILSPFVLSPFILSPVVLSPLILSPFCLSPFIGVPNALTPIILSPFVLSPLILSPPYVSAFVLSPYALSPAVMSNGALFTAVLSPSWLSTL